MFHRDVISRAGSLGACAAAVFLHAGVAGAQTCTGSYRDAQEKEKAGHLVQASDLYASCAKKACGPFLLDDCAARHARLDADIPSVVPVGTDKSGSPRRGVRVTLDGEPFASDLDGHAFQVDPGWHEFVFSRDGNVSVTKKIMILQGDRNRRITVTLTRKRSHDADAEVPTEPAEEARVPREAADAGSAGEVSQSKGVPALSWVLGGVGVLGAGGFVLFSTWGRKDNDALQQQCSTFCQPSSVDHVKQQYLFADISLGVGVAALGSAVLVYALSGDSKEPAPERQAYKLDVHATASGAVAGLSGSF